MLEAICHYLGWQPTEEEAETSSAVLPVERTYAAFDGSRIVGGAGSYGFELTVPGGRVPSAGVTVVGVLPTHRRRGFLRRMMHTQLADLRERGEPVAVLWASDEQIYGRYGYGLASLSLELALPRSWATFRPGLPDPRGAVRLLDQDEALRALPTVYDRVRATTPGFVSRTRAWWESRVLSESEWRRRGAGPLNKALLEVDGRPAGYALYRIKRDDGFKGSVRVVEALGADAAATRDVWRFLLSIDWMDEITARLLPVDHPLVLQVGRMTKLGLAVQDGLWVRLVDVASALSARRYRDGRVALEVTGDPVFPDNTGAWTIEDGVVRRGARRRPDVRLDVGSLAAVYLGGFTFAELARAQLVEEATRGGVARADAVFRSDVAPWCPEIF